MKHKFLFLFVFVVSLSLKSQNRTTFGLQYKPIVPAAYFNSSGESKMINGYSFTLTPKYSNSFGMIIKHQINAVFSIESGLNYIQRNYRLKGYNNKIGFNDFTDFGMRSYELPIQLLAYVRASEKWYLNVAFGISNNILASNIFSYGEENQNFFQNTYRKSGGYRALLANIGMEYRTEKKGFFYFGTSLHRPWKTIGMIYPEYNDNTNIFNDDTEFSLDIFGAFVTLDFRYFFAK
ncbi:MAG: hypothetical protein H8E84_06315 [Flavobacteriales bacterium]|nr:hypothetical protein [Flavobacteriales bacterium]